MNVTLLNPLRNLPGLSWGIYIVTISKGAALISDVIVKNWALAFTSEITT